MRFLDSDVKKPLAGVSAMNDEGNTVVFSKKWRATSRMRDIFFRDDLAGEED